MLSMEVFQFTALDNDNKGHIFCLTLWNCNKEHMMALLPQQKDGLCTVRGFNNLYHHRDLDRSGSEACKLGRSGPQFELDKRQKGTFGAIRQAELMPRWKEMDV